MLSSGWPNSIERLGLPNSKMVRLWFQGPVDVKANLPKTDDAHLLQLFRQFFDLLGRGRGSFTATASTTGCNVNSLFPKVATFSLAI